MTAGRATGAAGGVGGVAGAGGLSGGATGGTKGNEGALGRRKLSRCLIIATNSGSRELECVFLSPTPKSGSISMMTRDGTSSSRASSLIRIPTVIIVTALSGLSSRLLLFHSDGVRFSVLYRSRFALRLNGFRLDFHGSFRRGFHGSLH